MFALAGHVPSVGIGVDAYTNLKISGALTNAGLGEWSVPSIALGLQDSTQVLNEAWSRRAEISTHLTEVVPALRDEASRWWDDVAAVLSGPATIDASALEDVPSLRLADRELRLRLDSLRIWVDRTSTRQTASELAWQEERESLAGLERQILEAELAAGQLHADLLSSEERVAESEDALMASRARLIEMVDPAFLEALRPPEAIDRSGELLGALLQTRTIRWSRMPRKLYARVRYGRGTRQVL